jgi:hypothetical protein
VNDGAPTEAGATTGGNHRAEDTTEVHPLFAWRDLIQKSDLPPTARHVALNLSTHMNLNGGSCFPSLETQASETGLHKSTVVRSLNLLEWAEYLERFPGGGAGIPTRYQLKFPSWLLSQRTTVAQGQQSRSAHGTVAYDAPTVAEDEAISRVLRPEYFSSTPVSSSITLHGDEQSQRKTVQDLEAERRSQEHTAGLHDRGIFPDCPDCSSVEASRA